MLLRATLFLCAVVLLGTSSAAQEAWISTGGQLNGPDGSLSYSVGQIFYQQRSSGSGSVSEGVQQPYVAISTVIDQNGAGEMSIRVFPNPATISIAVEQNGQIALADELWLYDSSGKLVLFERIADTSHLLDVSPLPTGLYRLLLGQAGKPMKRFNITKL